MNLDVIYDILLEDNKKLSTTKGEEYNERGTVI